MKVSGYKRSDGTRVKGYSRVTKKRKKSRRGKKK